MNLKEVMELGGQNLLGWLNPDRDYLPITEHYTCVKTIEF